MSFFNIYLAQLNPVAFNIGPFSVRWYGIILGVAILISYVLFERESRRKNIDADTSFDILFWTVVIGLIGARLYYVVFSLDQYIENPIKIFFVWEGGLAIYGGVIAGAAAIYYLCKKYELNFLNVLDIAVPSLMAGQAIGRWGNFMNQEAHGGPVDRQFLENLLLPDFIIEQMNIQGTYYHPTFLYESLWSLLGLGIVLLLRRREEFFKRGGILAFYLIWYGSGRLVIEGFRTDSLYIGPFRVSQLVSIGLIILGAAMFLYIRGNSSVPYYSADRNTTEKGRFD